MNKLKIAIAAALGGAVVYWWIKRKCPCKDAAASSTLTASRDAAAGIASHLGATLGDAFGGKDAEYEGGASAANLSNSAGGLSADVMNAGGAGGGAYTGPSSPSSAGCTSCGDGPSSAVAPLEVMTAQPASPYDGFGTVTTSQPLFMKALSFAGSATSGSFS
jgi:hypothetical protein